MLEERLENLTLGDLTVFQSALNKSWKIFENNPSLMILSSVDKGEIIDLNETFTQKTGFSRENFINKPFENLVSLLELEFLNNSTNELKYNQTIINTEVKIKCSNDRYLYGLLTREVIEDQDQNIFLYVINDITDRINAEQMLKYNEKLISAFAYSIKELLANPNCNMAIYHCFKLIGEAAKIDRISLFENQYDVNGNGFSNLVIEWGNKSIEDQTNKSKWQKLSYNEIDVLIDHLSTNKSFVSLYSKTQYDKVKKLMESQNILSLVVLPVFSNENFWGFVKLDECKSERQWNKSEISMLVAFSNSLGKAIERTKIQKDLLLARNEADMSNNAKRQFIANMSHEIRTPLNGIAGIIDLLLYTDTTAEQKKYLEMLKESSSILSAIVKDILNMSKIESGKFKIHKTKSDIRKIISNTVGIVDISPKSKNIKFKIDINPDIPEKIYIDSDRIKQILLNLLSNSVKFTDDGEIKINVSKQLKDGEDYIKFSVVDTGIGIDKIDQKSLFKPYFQADNSITRNHGGTGLGLAICKKLVNLMGGEIYLSSEKGIGTEVFFTIPYSTISKDKYYSDESQVVDYSQSENLYINSDFASIQNNFLANQVLYHKKLKILIVEDNEINQILLCKYLELLNHTYSTASNGEEALKIFNDDHFDLIIMDLQMPVLDGYSTTRLVRETQKGKNIPIIAITAYAMEEDKEKCYKSGMNYFISKPFILSDLDNILNKIKYSIILNDIIKIDTIDVDIAFKNVKSDMGFFTDIVEKFKISSRNLLIKIKESLEISDCKALNAHLHSLKGMIVIFEDKRAFELLKVLEEFSEVDDIESATLFIHVLEKEIMHLYFVLDKFIIENTGKS